MFPALPEPCLGNCEGGGWRHLTNVYLCCAHLVATHRDHPLHRTTNVPVTLPYLVPYLAERGLLWAEVW